MDNYNLSNEQVDVLREIGTIGGGNAATALSQLLSRKVTITVPQVRLISPDRIIDSDFLIAPEEVSLPVSLKILGALNGGMVVLFSKKSALLMIDILLKRTLGSTQLLNVIEASALSESAHILSGSYLNVVGELLKLHQVIPSIPQIVVDRLDRLDNLMIKSFIDQKFQYLMPIENNLLIENIQVRVYVIFMLESESIKKILKIIGV